MSAFADETAIFMAGLLRKQCICEEGGGSECKCPVPITREQVTRLKAYQSLRPDQVVIYSEKIGRWMSAVLAYLPLAKHQQLGVLRR
jgi:hypothetical protein